MVAETYNVSGALVDYQDKMVKRMMNPCVSYCFTRFGKEYSKDCDEICNYAKIIKERDTLRDSIDKILEFIDNAHAHCIFTERGLVWMIERETLRDAVLALKGEQE